MQSFLQLQLKHGPVALALALDEDGVVASLLTMVQFWAFSHFG